MFTSNMFRNVVLCFFLGVASVEANCSFQGSPACISAIKQRFNKDDLFWWGTWFDTNCASASKLYCTKPSQLAAGKTLKSAIPEIDETEIDTYLTVTYTSKPGSYNGCDTKVTRNEARTFSLDPLTSTTYPSWDARDRPLVQWESTLSGAKYTLVILDVGVGIVHGVWANIEGESLPGEGSTLDKADEVWGYRGPKNPFYERPNPYVFLLFHQSGGSKINIQANNFGTQFYLQTSMANFINTYNLKGPIGANWLITEGDVYGTNWMKENNRMYNCPSYVKRASLIEPHNTRPFLPTSSDLSVFVHASISAPAISYTICCDNLTAPASNLVLDPIENPTFTAAGTRTDGTTQEISFEKSGSLSGSNSPSFSGEKHTLLVVDPDVPVATAGTNSHPILHMLVTNIKDGIFSTGDVLQPYQGPRPPDNKPHVYYFLLYKQKDAAEFSFNFMDVQKDYVGSNTCGRCLFDVASFVTQKQLELVGATWMTVPNDKYVDYSYVQSGRNESQYCPGWTQEQACPTQGACTLTTQIPAVILSLSLLLNRLFL